MKTIQERLRSPKPTVSQFGGMTGREPSPLELTAADEIDRLQAQVASIAAELRAEVEASAQALRDRDEARAEVAALCGNPEALDPFLPEGWAWSDGLFSCWLRSADNCRAVRSDRGCVWGFWPSIISTEPTPLAAMRSADEALKASK